MAKYKVPKVTIPLCVEQIAAKDLVITKPVSFLTGKPGTGKTWLACHIALSLLNVDKDKIIITRPTVGTEDNGFIPGDINEKLDPWMVPIRDNIRKLVGTETLQKLESDLKLQLVSLQHFRGRTFENSVCIVDEFQNLKCKQLAMVIGRLGVNSMMILCGDSRQIDVAGGLSKSAFSKMELLRQSKHVNIIDLQENHRLPELFEILELLDE